MWAKAHTPKEIPLAAFATRGILILRKFTNTILNPLPTSPKGRSYRI
jgi:hypothetical protein